MSGIHYVFGNKKAPELYSRYAITEGEKRAPANLFTTN